MNGLIIVTHLLGTGHLRRAVTLGRSFAAAGHDTRIVSGGTPVEGLKLDGAELVQLPPLKSDGTRFTTLLTSAGKPASDSYLQDRRDSLLRSLADQPDVLITELYPFGRRVLSEEFAALLNAARTLDRRPLILCSIRDILAPTSKPEKATRTHDIIRTSYDGVLVHSDPDTTPLSASWPVNADLEHKTHYTGFVTAPPPARHPEAAGEGEVIVSAGGGAVGGPLFRAASGAARLSPDLTWRLLVGGHDPGKLLAALRDTAPSNVIVEAARPDFRQMLNHARCSISLAGYNTAMDLLQTGVPALLVPFDDGGEVEQTLRATSLSKLPGIEMVTSAKVTPELLADRVKRLSETPRRAPLTKAMDGAAETVRLTERLRSRMA